MPASIPRINTTNTFYLQFQGVDFTLVWNGERWFYDLLDGRADYIDAGSFPQAFDKVASIIAGEDVSLLDDGLDDKIIGDH